MTSTDISGIVGFVPYLKRTKFSFKISIRSNGIINLGTGVVHDHDLQDYEAISLYWNEQKRSIAIVPVKHYIDKSTIRTLGYDRDLSQQVNADNFFKTIGEDPRKIRGRYTYRRERAAKYGMPHGGHVFIVELPPKQ